MASNFTEIGFRCQNSSIGGSTSKKFVNSAYLIMEKVYLFTNSHLSLQVKSWVSRILYTVCSNSYTV